MITKEIIVNKKALSQSISLATLTALSLSMPVQVQADEHSLSLTARTHFGQVDRHFGPEDSEEMSQTLRLDYQSPMYNGVIGVDASFYSIFKLHADKNTAGIPLLDENGDGFTKIGQANIKIKPSDNSELRIGRMRVISPLLMDTDGRSEPSTRQAVRGSIKLGDTKLYGIYSDRVSTSGSDSFEKYTSGGDGVTILGGNHRFSNGLGLHLSHGRLQDAKQQTFVNASYELPLGDSSLALDLYHYMAQDIGDKSNLADSTGSDGKFDTSLSNIAASLNNGDFTYTLSFQTVGDDLYDPSWDGFNNDRTVLWSWNSVQILDFYNANQDSLQLRVDYRSSDIPGLSLMGRYTEGDYDAGGTTYTDKELDIESQYVIQSGAAKGLKLKLRYADVAIGGAGDLEDLRLIADYQMNLL